MTLLSEQLGMNRMMLSIVDDKHLLAWYEAVLPNIIDVLSKYEAMADKYTELSEALDKLDSIL